MKYIKDMQSGDRISGIYLCKSRNAAVTKTGKPYDNVVLQDKTGMIDAKVWEPNSDGIGEFDAMDYVDVFGEVTVFNGALQLSIKRARTCREGEYNPSDYLPVSEQSNDEMFAALLQLMDSIGNSHLRALLSAIFVEDQTFAKKFRLSSAAKTMHHAFIGGLLEHTLSVARLCDHFSRTYPFLNRALLVSAAILHDIGKTRELSPFPQNDYTDAGQFLGHIVIGTMMIEQKAQALPSFPPLLLQELQHCILAHHGEYEYGSPKKPAIAEAVALNLADNTDAKMEMMKELQQKSTEPGWQGFNRTFESNLFLTRVEERN